MYVCDRCGEVTDEIESYTEWHGAEGTSNYGAINFDKPCSCGGDFVEARRCQICGEWHDPDNMNDGICEECLEKQATISNAYNFGNNSDSTNDFLTAVLDVAEIEEILLAVILQMPKERQQELAKRYLLSDNKTAFAEYLNQQKQ